jgi:hypothetical protein
MLTENTINEVRGSLRTALEQLEAAYYQLSEAGEEGLTSRLGVAEDIATNINDELEARL